MVNQKISDYFQLLTDFDVALQVARQSTPPAQDDIRAVEACLTRFLKAASERHEDCFSDDYIHDIGEVAEAARSVGVNVESYLHLLGP